VTINASDVKLASMIKKEIYQGNECSYAEKLRVEGREEDGFGLRSLLAEVPEWVRAGGKQCNSSEIIIRLIITKEI
jgi:hypothetical protein